MVALALPMWKLRPRIKQQLYWVYCATRLKLTRYAELNMLAIGKKLFVPSCQDELLELMQ